MPLCFSTSLSLLPPYRPCPTSMTTTTTTITTMTLERDDPNVFRFNVAALREPMHCALRTRSKSAENARRAGIWGASTAAAAAALASTARLRGRRTALHDATRKESSVVRHLWSQHIALTAAYIFGH